MIVQLVMSDWSGRKLEYSAMLAVTPMMSFRRQSVQDTYNVHMIVDRRHVCS